MGLPVFLTSCWLTVSQQEGPVTGSCSRFWLWFYQCKYKGACIQAPAESHTHMYMCTCVCGEMVLSLESVTHAISP